MAIVQENGRRLALHAGFYPMSLRLVKVLKCFHMNHRLELSVVTTLPPSGSWVAQPVCFVINMLLCVQWCSACLGVGG